MADFALPQALSISDIRRNAMPAMRRTVLHGTTSQNVYGAGELVYIPVDTGTAGAFFLPETSRLDMDVTVYNRNYFVDFFNLPRCGFHCLVEEFGIEIHNSLHENQRFYAEMIELEMIRRGENMVPFEMTVSNPHKVGGGIAGDLHINLIKPSMVTTVGLPHGVAYPPLVQPHGSNISSTVANDLTEGLLLNAVPSLKKPTGRLGFGDLTPFHETAGIVSLPLTYETTGLSGIHGQYAQTNFPAPSFYDDRIHTKKTVNYYPLETIPQTDGLTTDNGSTASRVIHGYNPYNVNVVYPPQGLDNDGDGTVEDEDGHVMYGRGSVFGINTTLNQLNTKSGSCYAFDTQVRTSNRFAGYPCNGGVYSKYHAYTDSNFGTIHSDNSIFQVRYGQSVGGYTPMMWPAKQPCDTQELSRQLKEAKRGTNTKNIQNYYANCKNISCAIPVRLTTLDGQDQIWGNKLHTLPPMSSPKGEATSFRVSLKLYSCLLGVYAKKWFPSLLIGAGRMRIRLKLQQPNIAFQTLLDPCRIVPHTSRDRFPYLGVFQTVATPAPLGQQARVPSIGTITDCDIRSISHSINPVLLSDYLPGSCYNDLVALGKFPVPQMNMAALHEPCTIFTTQHKRAGGADPSLPLNADNAVTSNSGPYDSQSLASLRRISGKVLSLNIQPQKSIGIGMSPNEANYLNYINAVSYQPNLTDLQREGRIDREFENVYKVLSDLTHELVHNLNYGFPSRPYLSQTKQRANRNVNLDDRNVAYKEDLEEVTSRTPIYSIQQFQKRTHFDNFYHNAIDGFGLVDGELEYSLSEGRYKQTQNIMRYYEELKGGDYQINGLNWQIHNYPLVQYVPTAKPWDKQITRVLSPDDFVNEAEMCYGTYLERSVAQVRRTNRNLFPLSTNNENLPNISERLTYTVSNITYRVEEVILPESASMQIISAAMEGGITMEADSIKSIEQIVQKQDNQKILLNVSGGIVNDVCFVFQPTEMLQGDKAYGYNSYAFYCPWTSFNFDLEKQPIVDSKSNPPGNVIEAAPNTPDVYNYLGGAPRYHNALHMGPNIGLNTFLSIATEYFPRNPINDLQTLIDHVTWGDQRRGDVEYLGLEPHFQNSYDIANFQKVSPFQDGFYSVFTPIECLNDQTITDNPFWTPLEENVKKLIRGRRATGPALPFLKPLEGTFHLSFNLQAFMMQHDRMNVGTPMVNNNSYLQMANCHLLRDHECRMLTFIRCFARIVIERGGVVQIFT